jgi:hypothetical protein
MSDTAEHTLKYCTAWEAERTILKETIGEDLSLPTIVHKILLEKDNWKAFSIFCSSVMTRKKVAEREKQNLERQSLHRN